MGSLFLYKTRRLFPYVPLPAFSPFMVHPNISLCFRVLGLEIHLTMKALFASWEKSNHRTFYLWVVLTQNSVFLDKKCEFYNNSS